MRASYTPPDHNVLEKSVGWLLGVRRSSFTKPLLAHNNKDTGLYLLRHVSRAFNAYAFLA